MNINLGTDINLGLIKHTFMFNVQIESLFSV